MILPGSLFLQEFPLAISDVSAYNENIKIKRNMECRRLAIDEIRKMAADYQ
jgi:hypothetical protein